MGGSENDSGNEQSATTKSLTGVEPLMREYFVLKDQSKRLKEARNDFMEGYECTNMQAGGYMEPPESCVHRSYHADKLEDDACEPCKKRHWYYRERQKNSRRRGVIMRLVRNRVRVTTATSPDSEPPQTSPER